MEAIRPEAIRAHMRFLSDSLLEGRATGSHGYDVAAAYVASQLEGMGLQPAGIKRGWYQPVPLRHSVLEAGQTSVVFAQNGNQQTLTEGKEYAIAGDMVYTDTNVEAPVVFVGFGVTATDLRYDDYASADVRGKIVATVYGAPARFESTQRAYYSDGLIKAKNAVAHGAVGILAFLLPDEAKRYPWEWLVPQIQAGGMRWLEENGAPHDTFPELKGGALLSQQAAERLFAGAPKTFEQAMAAARTSTPQAFPLPTTVRVHTVSHHTAISSANIVGVLTGSDPGLRRQYVVYTAHVDHLGKCPAVDGDDVCRGAYDNASGTASLLEIARAYVTMRPPPRRSVLFVFVTGEEMGLLGSDYFANHPTVPLESIVANVNIDGAPGLLFPPRDLVALGAEHSTLNRDVEESARQMGYELSPDPMPEEVAFIRSDQYSFVRRGVPAVDIIDGSKSTDPKIDGLKVTKTWLTTLYHTPKDNMSQPFDFEAAVKGTRLNFLIGYHVAQDGQAPVWNPGDFFGIKFARNTGASSRER